MSQKGNKENLALVFVYSKDFMERVIRNLINDPCFCQSCGLYCESCKYNVYSFVQTSGHSTAQSSGSAGVH